MHVSRRSSGPQFHASSAIFVTEVCKAVLAALFVLLSGELRPRVQERKRARLEAAERDALAESNEPAWISSNGSSLELDSRDSQESHRDWFEQRTDASVTPSPRRRSITSLRVDVALAKADLPPPTFALIPATPAPEPSPMRMPNPNGLYPNRPSLLIQQQWISLFALTAGVGIVQLGSVSSSSRLKVARAATDYDALHGDSPPSHILGLFAVVTACLSSGFAGCYFEKILKAPTTTIQPHRPSVWIRNVQLSLIGIATGLPVVLYEMRRCWLSVQSTRDEWNATVFGTGIRLFFEGFNSVTWIVILLQVTGGLLGALVIQHADNLLKCFSTSLSILLSVALSVVLFDFHVTVPVIVGAVLVVVSTFTYSFSPSVQHGIQFQDSLGSPVHTHSPALLRAAISDINERNSAMHSARDGGEAAAAGQSGPSSVAPGAWRDNVVVSHPPSPKSMPAALSLDAESNAAHVLNNLQSLGAIRPLDPSTLRRVPLSTPPRTPPPGNAARKHTQASSNESSIDEQAFPLILVTGGSGYIGSHTVLEILQEGAYGVVVIDNMANSNVEVLHRVRLLAAKHHKEHGRSRAQHPPLYFHECDITSRTSLEDVFAHYASGPTSSRIVSAIHFAALKSVSGSILHPVQYYQVNVGGTLNLIEVMARWNVKKLVFSSSCVVYGSDCDGEGITEDMCNVIEGASKGITNPYGRTKRMCEEILADVSRADPSWLTMALRYTNPSGAHPSGYIGEDPTNAANLMPVVTQVLQGKRAHVEVFGSDYDTPDGTGVRDFIHVVDLARAHLAAVRKMHDADIARSNSTYNLGTNQGTSVLTVIETLSMVAQRPIKIVISPRRPGDLGCVVCNAEKAERDLGWKAERSFVEMARDMVHWQFLNPYGYATKSDCDVDVD
ncbi:hypothetical protein OIV83_002665 [Microbotryomycetes sp. JL201]|nr:hypothetical protein OIV83_002665 [Microbotryomycetes sp. JL201]